MELLDTEEKRIMDKISGIVSNKIILARQDGSVIYPDNGEKVSIEVENVPANKFYYANGFGYLKCNLHYEDNVLFMYSGAEAQAKEVLNLVCMNFVDESDKQEKEKENFYRGLMLKNDEAIGKIDTWILPKSEAEEGKVQSYAVIYVRNFADNVAIGEGVYEILRNIFPSEMGFETISMEKNSLAILAFISKENTYEDVKMSAEAVGETVSAEAMTNVCVSMGSEVNTLDKLYISYEEAVKYCKIGLAFGITEGCIDGQKLGLSSIIYSIPESVGIKYLSDIFGKMEKEEKNGAELIETVNCFLQNNQNISETSRQLYVHRNTLMYRIEKFNNLTGLDCTKFDDGVKIRIAIMLQRYLKHN